MNFFYISLQAKSKDEAPVDISDTLALFHKSIEDLDAMLDKELKAQNALIAANSNNPVVAIESFPKVKSKLYALEIQMQTVSKFLKKNKKPLSNQITSRQKKLKDTTKESEKLEKTLKKVVKLLNENRTIQRATRKQESANQNGGAAATPAE